MKLSIHKLLAVGLFALSLALPANAGPVDAHHAGEVARAFFRNDPNSARRMAPLQLVERYDAPLTKAGDLNPAFHIFNRAGGGFVIISGDDACKPILAYSFDESFGDVAQMPDGLQDWLNDFEEQVALVRTKGVSPMVTAKAKEAWMAIEFPTKAESGFKKEILHKTSSWNQGDPYNRLCPTSGGKHGMVGCVPLAMGIIMNFFGYPAQGSGTLPSYSYSYDGYSATIEGYELGYPYEWEKFRDVDFHQGYTDDQANAMALLLRDVGVAAKAWYNLSIGTDSNFWRLIPAVIEHFGYDPNVTHLKRDYFTDEQWLDMLKGDLQDHPLIYAAGNDGMGHAFVVDGYDSNNNVHINWGWGGGSNGYYSLSAFILPSGADFKYAHTTVLGLVPDKGNGGQPYEYFILSSGNSSDGVYYNGMSAVGNIERGTEFKANALWLNNAGITPMKGKFFFALTDSEGNIVERISDIKEFGEVNPRGSTVAWRVSCTITCWPMEGDQVRFFYRSDNWPEGEWKNPLYDLASDVIVSLEVTPDQTPLSDVTSLSYDKNTGNLVLTTKDRVSWSLKKSGTLLKEGASEDFKITVPTSDLSLDNYMLTLTRGSEKQSLTVKMGKK